jgi:protein ImuB
MDGSERMGNGGQAMSRELYACFHSREFPLQSLSRLRPELGGNPVAVLSGRAPLETVCSMNRAAVQTGAVCGMTRLEAEGIRGLRLLRRSIECETAAREVFLECAANFSPRIEMVGGDTHCACVLDIAGTERLFGPPITLAQRMRDALAGVGFRASVAVSANFHTALLKAAASGGISVIPEGHEAAALANLPLDLLRLPEKEAETLAIWGIRSLGELAVLPEVDFIERLGQVGKRWRDMAWGALPHLFEPVEPKLSLQEFCEFESAVEQIDSVLFVASRMIDSLVTRASGRALSLALLTIAMRLEGGRSHQLTLRPALPSTDKKFLLKLLQIELAAHPPQSAIVALTIAAEAGHANTVQLGLFLPQLPEPSRLDVTLARLKALVGDDRVGSPVLEDTHCPDAFRMEAFVLGIQGISMTDRKPRMALRRLRPPHPVKVFCADQKPVAFHDGHQSYSIAVAYGPWRTSGCWWATGDWDRDEWDVLIAQEQCAHLLVNDHRQDRWYLEAVYD